MNLQDGSDAGSDKLAQSSTFCLLFGRIIVYSVLADKLYR